MFTSVFGLQIDEFAATYYIYYVHLMSQVTFLPQDNLKETVIAATKSSW